MLERMPKMIRFSPPTWGSLNTSSPPMIGARLLLHREGLIMIIPRMTQQLGDTTHAIGPHLGQKPKLGGRYTDITLIYISCFVGSLYIHCFVLFFVFVSASLKHKNTKNISVVSLGLFLCFVVLVCLKGK